MVFNNSVQRSPPNLKPQERIKNKSVLMSWIYGSLANGEMDCDTSNRIEQKRARQWSMDTSEQELFSNKKQAVKSASSEPASGAANMSISLLGNTSSSQPSHIVNCLFRPEPVRSSNFADKNVSHFVAPDLNMRKKADVDQVEIDSSICLSKSHDVEGLNASNEPASGAANMSISLLGNSPSSQSGHIGGCLFRPEPIRNSNFADKYASLFVTPDLNMQKKAFVDKVEIDSSICLSKSLDVEGPLCLNAGVRKIKVNQGCLRESPV
ncbi:TDBD domain-containing protein [Abeliophyllum distichum]|uniref:TDBD domain-containing protein n=1 Tax=Abeliophyllum distichum TaxID=126358 RepID=A0ABD1TWJ7_9LAMI